MATSCNSNAYRIAWFAAILLVGILVALATQNAIAGAVLPTLYSGHRLLKTGIWVLYADDDQVRGRVCFTFYLSAACWMGSAAALTTMALFILVKAITGDDPDMERFAATMITLAICVALSSMLGVAATIAALSQQIRVWVHPRLHGLLAGNSGDAQYHDRPFQVFNYAVLVLATSIAFPILAIGFISLLQSTAGFRALAVLVGGPIGILIAYVWASERMIASCPAEYWAIRSQSNH